MKPCIFFQSVRHPIRIFTTDSEQKNGLFEEPCSGNKPFFIFGSAHFPFSRMSQAFLMYSSIKAKRSSKLSPI